MSQAVTSQPRRDAWQALKELHFVTDFFSWLFALFSRLAEPLMLLCTLYIVAEAGVPSIALPALHNLAIGIMICAPEIILPGSFVVASRAQEHARLLFAVCWAFVALTLLTLISLFVWHFAGASLAWLMCARCAAAVGYSILMRVMSHGQPSVPDVTEHLSELSATIERTLAARITETEQRMSEHLTETLQSLERTVTERIERTSGDAQASQTQMRAMLQEMKAALEATTARPRLALVDRTVPAGESGMDKAAFVRQCFTEHPEMRNADIQRKASEQGVNISPAYISELRKAFTEEQSA